MLFQLIDIKTGKNVLHPYSYDGIEAATLAMGLYKPGFIGTTIIGERMSWTDGKDIVALRPANGYWQPIETVPDKGKILAYCPNEGSISDPFIAVVTIDSFPVSGGGDFYAELPNGEDWITVHPTHWMPLPEPPEVEA